MARNSTPKNTPVHGPRLGPGERAVYDLIRVGHLTPVSGPALYRKEVLTLANAGLISVRDGKYVLTGGDSPIALSPPPPPMAQVTTRLPVDLIAAVDALADARETNRSEIVRLALENYVAHRPSTAPNKSGERVIGTDTAPRRRARSR